jgi:hypothetical protein
MSERMTKRQRALTAGQRRKSEQIDLFESDPGGGMIGAPGRLELPAEARNVLIRLMARLIPQHASQSRMPLKTEVSHDV